MIVLKRVVKQNIKILHFCLTLTELSYFLNAGSLTNRIYADLILIITNWIQI